MYYECGDEEYPDCQEYYVRSVPGTDSQGNWDERKSQTNRNKGKTNSYSTVSDLFVCGTS